jgi:hypothetical protein
MGILKKIKKHFERKEEKLKDLQTQDIVNIHLYDTAKKTIFLLQEIFLPTIKESGANRLKELILIYKELGYNLTFCLPSYL